MNSKTAIKTSWTREEWQAGRKGRKAITDRITPSSVRRRQSSSDKRFLSLFDGERGSSFISRKVAEKIDEYRVK